MRASRTLPGNSQCSRASEIQAPRLGAVVHNSYKPHAATDTGFELKISTRISEEERATVSYRPTLLVEISQKFGLVRGI